MTMPRMSTMLLLTAGLHKGAACNYSNGPMTLPAVAARSGRIAFTSDRDGTEQIYLMNADGSNPTRLTRGPASNSNAAWSPDGTTIAFASNRARNAKNPVTAADGSRRHPPRRGGTQPA